MGGSVGVAILGAVFTNHLSANLADDLPRGAAKLVGISGGALNPEAVKRLPPQVHDAFIHAFTDSLNTVFLAAAAIVVLAFLLTFWIKQVPLRKTVAGAGVGEAFAVPKDTSSLAELARQLSVLGRREGGRRLIGRAITGAGVELSPGECWLLARLHAGADIAELARRRDIDPSRLTTVAADLERRRLISKKGSELALTASGTTMLEKVLAVSQARVNELAEDWQPDRYPELNDLIHALAADFLLDTSALDEVATASA
jgi:DNA-binding MarR family transcriptional regulator